MARSFDWDLRIEAFSKANKARHKSGLIQILRSLILLIYFFLKDIFLIYYNKNYHNSLNNDTRFHMSTDKVTAMAPI